jgi:hypothetical protein
VVILSVKNEVLKAFVSTSNSLSYVLSFNLTINEITFNDIEEMYNRYGHQICLNWGLINKNYVMLGYFNKTSTI